jgi:lysyl endopeptidase
MRETFVAAMRLPSVPALALLATIVLAAPARAAAPGAPAPASVAGGVAAAAALRTEVVPLAGAAAREIAAGPPGSSRPAPFPFATRVDVSLGPERAGRWEKARDGGAIWRLRVASPGARSINLGFTTFDLPPRATLWLYRPDRSLVRGPYTSADASPGGQLWTPVIAGDEVVVELSVPAGERDRVRLELGAVNQGFRDLAVAAQGAAFPCYTDVVCQQADPWRNQVDAVALYSIGGVIACTGTLLADTARDFRPFLLTARHCLNDQADADTVVVYWNYQSPACGQHGGGSLAQSQSGATLRATWGGSDFTLVELARKPDPAFHVFYAGWNASGDTPTSAVAIHQPKAVKVIAFADHPLVAVGTDLQPSPPLVWWLVDPYTSGTTDNGSSGACLFDQDKLCVGTLIDGTPASCDGTTDWYGRLSVGWDGGGTPDTSLRAWLDAHGTGLLALAGTPPYPPLNQVRRVLHPAR